MSDKEKWKDIEGFEGKYQISNKGRVKSLKRVIHKSNGRPHTINEKILSPAIRNTYQRIGLRDKGKVKSIDVHRLVGIHFVPNPKNNPLVLHKDDDPLNNDADNLYWGTRSDNMEDRRRNSHINEGENCGTSKLTNEEVLEMRCAYRLGCFTYKEIADAYDITGSHAWEVINRKQWKHI